jgi:hypothetical protein
MAPRNSLQGPGIGAEVSRTFFLSVPLLFIDILMMTGRVRRGK